MTKHNLKINLNRLKSTLDVSSEIGKTHKGGLNRLGLTKEDKEMRDVFVKWLKEANLNVRIDDIGNIYGRRKGKNEKAKSIMVGSHLDTQPNGGRFDGILGVLAALEVIRTLDDLNIETERPIEIVNFSTEEGARFGIPMEGSGVITENYTKDYVYNLKDKDGITYEQSLKDIGYMGGSENRPMNVEYFLELHIEQGPVLIGNNIDVGIVEGIKGVTKKEVKLKGQAVHAAHPAYQRRDALVCASEMVLAIDNVTKQFDDLSTTVGIFEATPSHASIVTGEVNFTFDARHINDEIRGRAINLIIDNIQTIANKNNIDIMVEHIWNMDGTLFTDEIISLIEEGAKKYNFTYRKITSGAGQDAKFMNDIAKAGMIFASSVDGLGHCEEELTTDDIIEKTTNVLLYVVESLANKS